MDPPSRRSRLRLLALAPLSALAAGCGLGVTSADLFVLQRVGPGRSLSMLVSDGGTIRCNGGPAHAISDPLLLQARDLATNLDLDAKASLRLAPSPNSVYTYVIKLQDGTISFADTDAARHRELAPAALFATEAAQGPCASR